MRTFISRSIILLILQRIVIIESSIQGCNYEDTVNITGSQHFANGSYLYNKILIPNNLIATYDYEILQGGKNLSVPSHTRGCVCKLKHCIKFCCHPKVFKHETERECAGNVPDNLNYNGNINVTLKNGTQVTRHIANDFVAQQGMPICDVTYRLIPEDTELDSWELFENGTLLRHYDGKYLSKHEYCFSPHMHDEKVIVNPFNCAEEIYEAPETKQYLQYLAILFSVPFLILTILVYLFIPPLRNLNGKCLICYMISLAIGFSMMALISLSEIVFSTFWCTLQGYVMYYFLMSAFLWLSVISFDLWTNCGASSNRIHILVELKRFPAYNLYAWGLAAVLTVLTGIAQISNLPEYINPGIGIMYCWLKPNDWTIFIYFYGPVLLILIFNLVIFILTLRQIIQIKKQSFNMVDNENAQINLQTQIYHVNLYFRLFVIMGLSWFFEILSYMFGTDDHLIVYFTDMFNALMGFIIFVILALNRKVRKLIKKRFCHETDAEINTNYSEGLPENVALRNAE